jgi:ATP-dependent RNA helicase DDX18/HAS1
MMGNEENGMGRAKKKKKKEEYNLNKGEGGGGILTRKLFSDLGISEPAAKAIRDRKYTHLTEVRSCSPPSKIHHLQIIFKHY